jgi:hypothetical protein
MQRLQLNGPVIQLETIAHRNVVDAKGQHLRIKRMVPVIIASATVCIPPIILLSILFAWPAETWRKKARILKLAIPVLVIISLIDIPFVLAWEVEDAIAADLPGHIKTIVFAGMALQTRVQDSQLLTYWYVFLQTGGRQFLAILGALLCIISMQGKLIVNGEPLSEKSLHD